MIATTETPEARRERLILGGLESVRIRVAAIHANPSLIPDRSLVQQVAEAAYKLGLETQADIVQPSFSAAELAAADSASVRSLSPLTQAMAINAVIRLLLIARTEFAMQKRFDGQVVLPRDEAVALSDVAEAALGLKTNKLLEGDLFETRL